MAHNHGACRQCGEEEDLFPRNPDKLLVCFDCLTKDEGVEEIAYEKWVKKAARQHDPEAERLMDARGKRVRHLKGVIGKPPKK